MKKHLSIILLATLAYGCKSKPERITINLEKGQVYTQDMSVKSSSEQTMKGTKTKSINLSESRNRFEVLAVKDTVYTIKVTYETMATKIVKDGDTINQNMPGQANPVASLGSKLVGKSFTMMMSNTGRVLETKGIDAIFNDLFSQVPEQLRAMMQKSLASAYGDSAIRRNAEMSRALYLAKAVKEGDTWPFENGGGQNIMTPKVKGVYTLDKVTDSDYEISNKSTIEIVNSPTPLEMQNFSIKYDVSGNMTSKNKVDRKTGMITEMKAVQDIKGMIVLHTTSQNSEEMVMPITAKNEVTLITKFIK